MREEKDTPGEHQEVVLHLEMAEAEVTIRHRGARHKEASHSGMTQLEVVHDNRVAAMAVVGPGVLGAADLLALAVVADQAPADQVVLVARGARGGQVGWAAEAQAMIHLGSAR